MRRVAITGVSGYIGSQLLARLDAHPEVEAIIGIDNRPPPLGSPKLRFFLRDIAAPIRDLFAQEHVDSAVHLAFVVKPARNRAKTSLINIIGTENFIEACRVGQVQHALYLGSTSAYGAHPDNPVIITEQSPLRPNLDFQYSREKAETDRMFQAYAQIDNAVTVTVLRSCVVLGPGASRSIGSKIFQRVMFRVSGFDPMVQYLHEEDLIEAMVTALEQRPKGIFNLAGDGLLRYTDLARLAQRPMMTMPRGVLGGLMSTTWLFRLQSGSNAPGLDFIMHPWVASSDRWKHDTSFVFKHSSEEAVASFLRADRS
ncbi:NAD-dependent epimerase/dehydratase family protein [Dehalococcoidia bacterium]|nr:NAD-dependent epimerase/dehydratase family protein [Dehalococcoidia bacterium]